jgi:ATP-dependent helicase HrpB
VIFARGGSGELSETSVCRCGGQAGELVVALEADHRRSGPAVIHRASKVEPEWLLELFPDWIEDTDEVVFNPGTEGVEKVGRLTYDGLVLDEVRRTDVRGEEVAGVLLDAVQQAGLGAICDVEDLEQWRLRVGLASELLPEIDPIEETDVTETLAELCRQSRSFDDLRNASLIQSLLARHLGPNRAAVEKLAPQTVSIPGRKNVPVHYEPDRPPWIEAFLQDFFGARNGPRIGGGKIPLVIHLLAPNRRAVQVTTDLAGFWQKHYPEVRRSLMRRYHKHYWPEDPTAAKPKKPGWRRRESRGRH